MYVCCVRARVACVLMGEGRGGGSVNLRSCAFPTALPSLRHKRTCVCADFSSVGISDVGIKKRAGIGGAHNHPP